MEPTQGRGTATGVTGRAGGYLVRHARQFAWVTVAATFVLILLGEFTAAAGAGATCNSTYPGCAGHLSPIGLSVPQFIEWFHRLFAMLTGYLIVGNAIVTWWDHRGTRASRAAWLAAVLLPLQVFFGGFTVTFAGRLPGGYSLPVQLSHFTTALAIFAALVVSAVWLDVAEGHGGTLRRLRLAAVGGGVAALAQVVFARGLLVTFWPRIQTAFHLFGLLEFACFSAIVLWARELGDADAALMGTAGAILTLLDAYLVIGVFTITARVEAATYLLLVIQFVLFALLTRHAWRSPVESSRRMPGLD